MKPVSREQIEGVLQKIGISDICKATIRQTANTALELERISGERFLHLELGIPGLEAGRIGIEAQKKALDSGVASVYPSAFGIPEVKESGSRFVNAFVGIDVPPRCIIPAVGSMQACYNLLLECSQLHPEKDTVVYIDPGFPSHYIQAKVLGMNVRSFDIHDFRGHSLEVKLEELLADGRVAAMIYSNPNNPSWVCLTEEELRTIGKLATRHDVIVLEDLAYLCMDFREDRSKPYQPPFQSTVARYTDNYALMISGSKTFSYAGERIAIVAISPKVYDTEYPTLKERYGFGRFGDNFALTYIYTSSSGAPHSAQYASAAMMEAAVEGTYDFVGDVREYSRRASKAKEIFLRHGFHIVYDKDGDDPVGNGFYFTVGYKDLDSGEVSIGLLRCGITTITLRSAHSTQEGVRVCVTRLEDEKAFTTLDERLSLFNEIV